MSENQTSELTKRVMIVGKHDYIIEKLEGILKLAKFGTLGSSDPERIMRMLREEDFDLLLIGGGIEPHSRLAYIEYIQSHKPDVRVVEHYGGPATILSEVHGALGFTA
ncbi:MAG: hypothetical protein MK081_10330 [Flavobacteriales bacterium]|nr:hypothetical protein [Flavobacteriales bacterium]